MIGIYIITNITTNKHYVGKSINVETRWKTHISKLNLNKHDNLDLQKDWNDYGKENFSFKLIEVCSNEVLTTRENHWIDIFNAKEKGYNFNNRRTNSGKWSKSTKKDIKVDKMMELCSFYIKDNTVGYFFFEDICDYMNMKYTQLTNFLITLNDRDFKKYNIYVRRNWDTCNEYVSFCRYDLDFDEKVESEEIGNIDTFKGTKKVI